MAYFIQRSQIFRLTRLLDMMYRPSWLAEEIHITTDTIYRTYLPAGCPFERDAAGEITIHGKSFAAWMRQRAKSRKGIIHLKDGEGYCTRCNAARVMIRPRLRHTGRYTKIYQGRCPECGAKVNRAYAASAEVDCD